VVGGAIQTFTNGYTVLVLGRLISGAGVGLLSSVPNILFLQFVQLVLMGRTSTIVPIYQSEISPPHHVGARPHLVPYANIIVQRGKLACIEFTLNIVGYAFSVVRIRARSPFGLLCS
jgi:hypothetical protein